MFGPRHTIESVVERLGDGLDRGTIVLRPEESSEADVEAIESAMRASLAAYRRRSTVLLLAGALAAASGIVLALLPGVPGLEGGGPGDGVGRAIFLLALLAGGVVGFYQGLKTRERSVELKTYLGILRMADSIATKRLVLRAAPGLREGGLVP